MDDIMVTDEIKDRLKPERGITKEEVERMNDMMEMKEELRKLNNNLSHIMLILIIWLFIFICCIFVVQQLYAYSRIFPRILILSDMFINIYKIYNMGIITKKLNINDIKDRKVIYLRYN